MRLSPFSCHCAIADNEKKQNEKEYPDRGGEVSLIEISHLGPRAPGFAAIRKDRLKIVLSMCDCLNSPAQRSLLLKKRDVRQRSEKEKEKLSQTSDCARIEKHLPKHHDYHEHRHERGDAEEVQTPCGVKAQEFKISCLKIK